MMNAYSLAKVQLNSIMEDGSCLVWIMDMTELQM